MKKVLLIIIISLTTTVFGQTAQEYYSKGTDKANSRDYTGAISEFNSAITLEPNFTDAYYNRATSKLYIKDYTGAIKDFDKAIDLLPEFVNAYLNRGNAKFMLHDLKGAIADFDLGIKFQPNNATLYFMRGQAKLSEGDADGGCKDLNTAKEFGDQRADKYIKQYCKDQSYNHATNTAIESLLIDWPESEGWKIASQQDDAERKTIELLKNNETFDNWSEIGTMYIYKKIGASMNIPIAETMNIMYKSAKNTYPTAKLTMLEKDETAKYPWIIYKIECATGGYSESQVWYAVQGTNALFLNFRAVKQGSIPPELQSQWIKFFKSSKIVSQ